MTIESLVNYRVMILKPEEVPGTVVHAVWRQGDNPMVCLLIVTDDGSLHVKMHHSVRLLPSEEQPLQHQETGFEGLSFDNGMTPHSPRCGIQFRGCAPECPKDRSERGE